MDIPTVTCSSRQCNATFFFCRGWYEKYPAKPVGVEWISGRPSLVSLPIQLSSPSWRFLCAPPLRRRHLGAAPAWASRRTYPSWTRSPVSVLQLLLFLFPVLEGCIAVHSIFYFSSGLVCCSPLIITYYVSISCGTGSIVMFSIETELVCFAAFLHTLVPWC